jgi:hypothetical protein
VAENRQDICRPMPEVGEQQIDRLISKWIMIEVPLFFQIDGPMHKGDLCLKRQYP